jgi:hypothetical protein
LKVKPTSRRSTLIVTTDGAGIASHAGSAALTQLTDRLGWTAALSAGMEPTRQRRSAHDPGVVLRDLIVAIADGGDCLADLSVLREQPELFGEVASLATAWRVIAAITPEKLAILREARRRARVRAWAQGAAPERITLDFDTTLVTAHSLRRRERRATSKVASASIPWPATWTRATPGCHPAARQCQRQHRSRPHRRAGAGDGAVADAAWGMEMLARTDSGGASHDFVNALRELEIRFSISFDLIEPVRDAILAMPESAWVPAITQAGAEREGAAVCELRTSTSRPGRKEPVPSAGASVRIPAHSSPSPTTRAFASKPS